MTTTIMADQAISGGAVISEIFHALKGALVHRGAQLIRIGEIVRSWEDRYPTAPILSSGGGLVGYVSYRFAYIVRFENRGYIIAHGNTHCPSCIVDLCIRTIPRIEKGSSFDDTLRMALETNRSFAYSPLIARNNGLLAARSPYAEEWAAKSRPVQIPVDRFVSAQEQHHRYPVRDNTSVHAYCSDIIGSLCTMIAIALEAFREPEILSYIS